MTCACLLKLQVSAGLSGRGGACERCPRETMEAAELVSVDHGHERHKAFRDGLREENDEILPGGDNRPLPAWREYLRRVSLDWLVTMSLHQ